MLDDNSCGSGVVYENQRQVGFTMAPEFFLNHQNTKLTDLAITSFLFFPMLNFFTVINLVEYATQTSN